MKRFILASEFYIWQWKMKFFPKPSEINEVIETKLETNAPLIDAYQQSVKWHKDEVIRVKIEDLPHFIVLNTPGELNPTQFLLTRENQIPYSLDRVDCLVTDCLYQLQSDAVVVFEIGFCGSFKQGIRIVTSKMLKNQFGILPEAFTAGKLLQATSLKPVLYIIGKGAAVWLTSEQKGEYISYSNDLTKEKIAIDLSYEFLNLNSENANEFNPDKVLHHWLEHQSYQMT